MLILNDIHIGFSRVNGTTPATQEALRTYLLAQLTETLTTTTETHVCVNGDLFDSFEVTNRDLIAAYAAFSTYLWKSENKLTLVAGNHDHSAKGEKVSAFQVLCRVLKDHYLDQIQLVMVDSWGEIESGVWAIAHYSSQDLFTKGMEELLGAISPGADILIHANYDNNFVTSSDHSLNVSSDMAKRFADAGATLYFAHEHQAREALAGQVVVFGNQWPTSIIDCLGNDTKYCHILKQGTLTRVKTWTRLDPGHGYAEIDWRTLDQGDAQGFIRVVGEAKAAEASDVINAIAKFRQKSTAFVITNNVKVEGMVEAEALPASFEAAKRFDVTEYIRKHLTVDEMKQVEELMGEES